VWRLYFRTNFLSKVIKDSEFMLHSNFSFMI
jgi:hypothetical protein